MTQINQNILYAVRNVLQFDSLVLTAREKSKSVKEYEKERIHKTLSNMFFNIHWVRQEWLSQKEIKRKRNQKKKTPKY